jgi:hypothetical protein
MFESRAPTNSKPKIVLFKKLQTPIALIVGWINQEYIVTNWFGYFKLHSPQLNCFEIENNGVITDGSQEAEQVVCDFFKSQLKNREIELFSFNHFSSQNPLWSELISTKRVCSKPIYKNSVNWITTLRNSRTGKLNNVHSKKTLQKLSRKANKFKKSFDNDLEIKSFNTKNEINSFICNAEVISKHSYQYSINIGVSNNLYWKNFLASLADGDYLKAYILFVKNEPVAYIMGAKYSNVLFLFATAFNSKFGNYSPGEYLRHELIGNFIEQGIDIIDYGYGDAIYKQRCGTENIREASIRIYGNGVRAFYSKIIDRFLTQFSNSLIYTLKNFVLFNKIKNLWRNKLIKKTAILHSL